MNESIGDKNRSVQKQENELKEITENLKSSSLYSGYLFGFEQSVSTQIAGKLSQLRSLIALADMVMQMINEAEKIKENIARVEKEILSASIRPTYSEFMSPEAIDSAEAGRFARLKALRNHLEALKEQYEAKMQGARNLVAGIN